jgi:hypothetical protein
MADLGLRYPTGDFDVAAEQRRLEHTVALMAGR